MRHVNSQTESTRWALRNHSVRSSIRATHQKVIVLLAARRTAHATVPPPLLNPKTLAPYLRHHPFAVETKGRRSEERREEKLGHVVIDPRRSSPKIGWDSSPLFVFPISMSFSCCSWWCRLFGCGDSDVSNSLVWFSLWNVYFTPIKFY